MRVFEIKGFARWARKEGITDSVVLEMAKDLTSNNPNHQIDSLPGDLMKMRWGKGNRSSRAGYRIIVGYCKPKDDRILFLTGFAKNERENLGDKEQKLLVIYAKNAIKKTDAEIAKLLNEGEFLEIKP
jgi:hypothetical protein